MYMLTTNTAEALKALLPEGAEGAFPCLDSVFYPPCQQKDNAYEKTMHSCYVAPM